MKFSYFKKLTYLEIVLAILIISLLAVTVFRSQQENFISETPTFIRNTDSDIYDDFYAKIYDDLLLNKDKNFYEIEHIFSEPNSNSLVLDIGSGTGQHINLLNKLKIPAIGLDNSPSMVKQAKLNFPKGDFRVGDVLDTMQFEQGTFSHILCLYFTIYYIKDKQTFLDNCYQWLQPNGILVLHLVNIHKFDPVIPSATSCSKNQDDRNTKSLVDFDKFKYTSNFTIDNNISIDNPYLDKPNASFKETFVFNNNNKTRINEHHFYMSSQQSILALARDSGFILQSINEMIPIDYKYNYIYTLQKPS